MTNPVTEGGGFSSWTLIDEFFCSELCSPSNSAIRDDEVSSCCPQVEAVRTEQQCLQKMVQALHLYRRQLVLDAGRHRFQVTTAHPSNTSDPVEEFMVFEPEPTQEQECPTENQEADEHSSRRHTSADKMQGKPQSTLTISQLHDQSQSLAALLSRRQYCFAMRFLIDQDIFLSLKYDPCHQSWHAINSTGSIMHNVRTTPFFVAVAKPIYICWYWVDHVLISMLGNEAIIAHMYALLHCTHMAKVM